MRSQKPGALRAPAGSSKLMKGLSRLVVGPSRRLSLVAPARVVSTTTPPKLSSQAPSPSSTSPSAPATARNSIWNEPSGQPGSNNYGAPLTGRPDPLGASLDASGGTNFAIYTSSAIAVSLVLFSEADLNAGKVTHEIPLCPVMNRTGDVWHMLVPRLRDDLLYGYRVTGFHQDRDEDTPGHRYDESKVVLDPYATSVLSRRKWGQMGPNIPYGQEGVLGVANTWPQAAGGLPSAAMRDFDWEGDRPLNLPMEQLVIYEAHVRGFTQHASSGVSAPGTYAGMIEKLDYLKSLGVTAIELMPIFEFNELEYYSLIPGSSNAYRYNFWGYSTVDFFAPMSRFSAAVAAGAPVRQAQNEFKALVKECHKRGIEVILDVVFNHTAEGNEKGPTISFRGLDNRTYYMLAPGGEYYNYSGCGNTLNCNQPAVRQFILDCLRHWVTEYHVDGFRFDLASILTRANSSWQPEQYDAEGYRVLLNSAGAMVNDLGIMTDGAGVPTGTPLPDPPLVEAISEDPVLRATKMIAEAWDCDGLNQVGAFPHYGGRWAEWNGKFRDVVRQFIKGTDGPWAGDFASAICGSPNIYATPATHEGDWWGNNGGKKWRGNRGPSASVNFVTAHDGFTLSDAVSYNEKHNDANGENNRDGETHNLTWNCGAEGPTDKWEVNRLRQRQMRNMAAALLISHGVPMIYMGDEYGHSKGGNNNTYCHDSDLNYLRWDQAAQDPTGFARFMRLLINFRRSRPELQRATYVSDNDIQWHGELANTPDWTETSRLVAFTIKNHATGGGLYVAFNSAHIPRVLSLPRWGGRVWRPLVDTSKPAPYDFLAADGVLSVEEVQAAHAAQAMWSAEQAYPILPWSCIVLESVTDDPRSTVKFSKAEAQKAASSAPHPPPLGAAARSRALNAPNGVCWCCDCPPQTGGSSGHHGGNNNSGGNDHHQPRASAPAASAPAESARSFFEPSPAPTPAPSSPRELDQETLELARLARENMELRQRLLRKQQ